MEDQVLNVKKDRQDEIVDSLLNEYKVQRDAIKDMIADIEGIKTKVDTLLPKSLDARYARLFEEKIKAITSLFTVLLDMRKEINKTLKDEIELRRRVTQGEEIPIEEMLDVRKFARKVDEFKKLKTEIQEKRFVELKKSQEEQLTKVTTPQDDFKREAVNE